MTRSSKIVRFGVFEVDLEAGELRKSGLKIKLHDQPFRILTILLDRPGEIVAREELRARLWPDGTFVDFDHSLNASVNKLREALGDSASGPRFIETVPRRGYRFVASVEQQPPPLAPRPARGKWVWLGAAAIIVVAGGLALRVVNRVPAGPPPNVVPLTSDPGVEVQPSFSPDGLYVAYTARPQGSDNFDIYVKQIGSESVRRLTTDPAPDMSPKWSPDGRNIAFVRLLVKGDGYFGNGEGAVMVTPALGGAERKIAPIWTCGTPLLMLLLDWFPDSENLVVADTGSAADRYALFVVNTRSGERWRLTTPPSSPGDSDPAVTRDGRRVAFARYRGGEFSEIYLLDLDGRLQPAGVPRQLTFDNRLSRAPAWTPTGRQLVFTSGPQHRGRLWRIAPTAGSPPEPLPYASEGLFKISASISNARNQLAYSTSNGVVEMYRTVVASRGVTASTRFLSSTSVEHLPAYSPDGRRIAFSSNRTGSEEIWISDADGSNVHPLTSFRGAPEVGWPRWSPEGRRLVFSGHGTVYVMDAGGGVPEVVASNLGLQQKQVPADWSADGKWIYLQANRTGRPEIWRIAADGSSRDMVQITRNGGGAPQADPSGEFVYYAKGSAPSELWRVPAGGGDEVRVIDQLSNNGNFAVTRDGVYYIPPQGEHGRTSIEFLNLQSRRSKTILPLDRAPMWGLAVSPDRRSILHVQLDEVTSDLMVVENFR